jgi:sRNA-binding carbon storage regulator CsrA
MTGDKSCVVVEIRAGESLDIGNGEISVELIKKSGQQARLRIVAPHDVHIERKPASPVVASMAT